MGLGNWIWSLWDKVKAFLAKAWNLGEPFIKKVLGEAAQVVWIHGQALIIAALTDVLTQGLPTDEAKQKAFKERMQKNSEVELNGIKVDMMSIANQEWGVIREMGLAVLKKSQEIK